MICNRLKKLVTSLLRVPIYNEKFNKSQHFIDASLLHKYQDL